MPSKGSPSANRAAPGPPPLGYTRTLPSKPPATRSGRPSPSQSATSIRPWQPSCTRSSSGFAANAGASAVPMFSWIATWSFEWPTTRSGFASPTRFASTTPVAPEPQRSLPPAVTRTASANSGRPAAFPFRNSQTLPSPPPTTRSCRPSPFQSAQRVAAWPSTAIGAPAAMSGTGSPNDSVPTGSAAAAPAVTSIATDQITTRMEAPIFKPGRVRPPWPRRSGRGWCG